MTGLTSDGTPPYENGHSQNRKKRANVLLVGSGRMGDIRASLVYANPRFKLCGVVDVNMTAATALAETYDTTAFSCLADAIQACQPVRLDGIIISTPTFTHAALIKEAAENGLFVFTEKPVDETADKIKQIFDVADDAGIKICCGFQRRFDRSYVAAAEAVKNGAAGKPVMANIFFGDSPCPPKEFLLTGGDIFMDCSAHDVDYIRWVLQDDVDAVYATGNSSCEELAAAGVCDNGSMIIKFRKGAVVTLFLSRSASYGYDQRCEIFGNKGIVSVMNEHEHSTVIGNSQGIVQSKLKHSFPQRFNQAFASELDAFADTLLDGKEWPVSVHDCIRVQKVADAARKSCELGQEVKLDYNPTKDVEIESTGSDPVDLVAM
mmetsp:Transcript_17650/g.24541  ORF Transcript_17650/g.24541 Transcript_17650/m.24541 type:complete len:377 (+) Transcript_17650:190-1320(+)